VTGGRIVEAGVSGSHVTGGIDLRRLVPWEVVPERSPLGVSFDGSGDERRRVGEPVLALLLRTTFRRNRRTVGLS